MTAAWNERRIEQWLRAFPVEERETLRRRLAVEPGLRRQLAEWAAIDGSLTTLAAFDRQWAQNKSRWPELETAVRETQSQAEATLHTLRRGTRRTWWLSAAATLLIAIGGLVWMLGNPSTPDPTTPSVPPIVAADAPDPDMLMHLDFLQSGIEPEDLLSLTDDDIDLLMDYDTLSMLVQYDDPADASDGTGDTIRPGTNDGRD